LGEPFDPAGITVKVTLSSGAEITYEDLSLFTLSANTNTPGSCGFTVSRNGVKSATYMGSGAAYYVFWPEYMTVTKNPNKTQYNVGEKIDLTGLEGKLYGNGGKTYATFNLIGVKDDEIKTIPEVAPDEEIGSVVEIMVIYNYSINGKSTEVIGSFEITIVGGPVETSTNADETTTTEQIDETTTTEQIDETTTTVVDETTTTPADDETTTTTESTPESTTNANEGGEKGNGTIIWIIVAAIAVIGIGLAIFLLTKKK